MLFSFVEAVQPAACRDLPQKHREGSHVHALFLAT